MSPEHDERRTEAELTTDLSSLSGSKSLALPPVYRTRETTAVAERAYDAATIDRVASEAASEELPELFRGAQRLHHVSWIAMAIVAGRAIERTDDDRMGYRRLAREFGVDKAEVVRLVLVYRKILRPRIEEMGPNAEFPVRHQTFYVLAARAEVFSEGRVRARDLIEVVEDAHAGGSRLTTREFADDLASRGLLPSAPGDGDVLHPSLASAAQGVLSTLVRFSAVDEDDVIERAADLMLTDYSAWSGRIADLRRLLDALEQRMAGSLRDFREELSRDGEPAGPSDGPPESQNDQIEGTRRP